MDVDGGAREEMKNPNGNKEISTTRAKGEQVIQDLKGKDVATALTPSFELMKPQQ